MKEKYVFTFQNGNILLNAVAKAPSDICTFLEQEGYRVIYIPTMGKETRWFLTYYLKMVVKLWKSVAKDSVVVVQYPVYSRKGTLILNSIMKPFQYLKKVKFIALVHDIRFLRGETSIKKKEIAELNNYSSIIVHSDQMGKALKDSGCKAPYSVLGLFDYYVEKENIIERRLSNNVCFAGNLAKSDFLKQLHLISNNGLSFFLYGKPLWKAEDGVCYCGAFDPNNVSSLNGSWGLVWDGNSIDSLSGEAGRYQTINSPHKASLYIAAELPLIVSSESAISSIVKNKKIGICVDSLRDLASAIAGIDEQIYDEMIQNVKSYSSLLRGGGNVMQLLPRLTEN